MVLDSGPFSMTELCKLLVSTIRYIPNRMVWDSSENLGSNHTLDTYMVQPYIWFNISPPTPPPSKKKNPTILIDSLPLPTFDTFASPAL